MRDRFGAEITMRGFRKAPLSAKGLLESDKWVHCAKLGGIARINLVPLLGWGFLFLTNQGGNNMEDRIQIIAQRISVLREIVEVSAEEMAQILGISVEEYLEYEAYTLCDLKLPIVNDKIQQILKI